MNHLSIKNHVLGINRLAPMTFPGGTLMVNIIGCFGIGLLYGLTNRLPAFNMEWRLFLITGICGGFTTFSSFSYEGISLILERNFLYFFLYLGCSIFFGLLATWVGILLIK